MEGRMRKKRVGTLTRHHRLAKSEGGSNLPQNISMVPKHKHRAYHLLFGVATAHIVAEILNEKWIDPEFELIAVRRKQ